MFFWWVFDIMFDSLFLVVVVQSVKEGALLPLQKGRNLVSVSHYFVVLFVLLMLILVFMWWVFDIMFDDLFLGVVVDTLVDLSVLD